jgi:hypothetical protein
MTHFLLHVGDLFHPCAPAIDDREAVLAEDTPAKNPEQPASHGPDSLALLSLTSVGEDPSPQTSLGLFSLLPGAEAADSPRDGLWPAGRWM